MAQKGTNTLKGIAASLGISAATVSRALAGNPRISEDTRDRVRKAAEKAGYAPNLAARSLVTGKGSGFVGFVLQDAGYGREDSYLSEFLTGLGRGLSEQGVDLFLSVIPEGKSELSVIRNIVTTRRADGLILGRTSEVDARVDYLAEAGFPFVTHGRVLKSDTTFSWVDTDGATAFGEAFDMLYELGHRRFGLLTIEEPMTFRGHRTEGLLTAIERRSDPTVTLEIATSPRYDATARRATVRKLLTLPKRPTAVLAMFDGLALALIAEAAELGLTVPGDVSIVGFDNTASAAHARPGLTTFDSDTQSGAQDAARMLLDRIATPEAPAQSRLIKPRLVLRASHGRVPKI